MRENSHKNNNDQLTDFLQRFQILHEVGGQLQHDLSGPLTVIQVALQNAKLDAELASSAREALSRIQMTLEVLNKLGKLSQCVLKRTELKSFFSDLKKDLVEVYPDKGFKFNIADDAILLTDPSVLVRSFSRIISFALDRTSETVYLDVSYDQEIKTVHITLAMDHVMINAQILKNIFQNLISFAQASEEEKDLWFVVQSIRALGGTFSLLEVKHGGCDWPNVNFMYLIKFENKNG